MRWHSAALLLIPATTSAEIIVSPSQIIDSLTPSRTILRVQTSTITPTPTTPIHNNSRVWDPLMSIATDFLDEVNEHLHIDLKKRQGAAQTGAVIATTIVTQMPAVTTFSRNGVAGVYTQLFVAVPDQWPNPEAGTIGLGTIVGQIGVVKSKSKRDTLPEATSAPAQVLRIKGREVKV